MKLRLKLAIAILALLFFNCSEEPTNPTGSFKVSGIIYQNNQTVSNISLQLTKNDEVIQETNSDEKGYFEFKNIAKERYTIVTKQVLGNGSFLEAPTEIIVNGDLYIESLILPEPVILLEPLSFTASSIELHWTPYTGEGFYEYKVYRHNSTALDETTGTLIHIATSANDTTFLDMGQENGNTGGLFRDTEFYYRVYVNNEYGKMGGSNILKAKTAEWDNEENFTAFYKLEPIKSFATQKGFVSGLDSDGENIWILIVESRGGYYDKNLVKIIKYDYVNDTTLVKFEYDDEYIIPRSLILANNLLWVYYDDVMGAYMKKISPETGEIVEIFSVPSLEDMSAYGESIYTTGVYGTITKRHLGDFTVDKTFTFPPFEGLIDGIASRENELWVTSRFNKEIVVFNSENGEHIGVVETDNTSGGPGFYITFVGNKVAFIMDGRIYVYNIVNNAP